MTAEQLASYAGIVLSLGLAYIPKLAEWYDSQTPKAKAGIMALLLAVVSLVIYGLSCAGLAAQFGLNIVCDQDGAVQLVQIFIAALIANQSIYLIGVRPIKR